MVQPMELMGEGDARESNQEDSFLEEDTGGRTEAPANNNNDRKRLEACRVHCASYEAMELCFCLLLLIGGLLVELLALQPRQRTIPFQLMESTGEYIINQIYDQPFEGEIVSGASRVVSFRSSTSFSLPHLI
jgi:hypothetical protein